MMWIANLPPFIPFFIAAALYTVIPTRARGLLLLIPIWGLANLYFAGTEGLHGTFKLLEFELQLMRVDKLSLMLGYLFHIAALISLLDRSKIERSRHHKSNRASESLSL